MKKYLFILGLFSLVTSKSFSQDIDQIAQRKVDSLKKLLPTVKQVARVDALNSIAQGLLWIYEDNDQLLFDALKYSDESLKLATKLNYKRGIGYALTNLFMREANQADTNRVENYRSGSHFQKAVAVARQAMKIGEDLHDDLLIGAAYNELQWLYRWKGRRADYEINLQESIEHFEAALKQNWTNIYTPLKLTDCDNCLGVEFVLGGLYADWANMQVIFQDETVEKLRKSITYYDKANAYSSAGSSYLNLSNVLAKFNDIRTAVAEAKKALPYYVKGNDDDGEFEVYQTLCGFYYELGDLENGLLYSRKAIQLAESLAFAKGPKDELNYPGDNEFLKERRLFQAYYWIGRFYTLGGDYDNAFTYFRKASQNNFHNRWSFEWTAAMGNLHRVTGRYDSALFYFNPNTAKGSLMRLYNDMKQYDKTLKIFEEINDITTQRNNLANLGRIYAYAAGAYYGKQEFKQALTYARKADTFFKTTSSNLERIDNYQLLSDIYQQVGRFDSAYIFLKQYNSLRDSVLNKQFYIRLNDFKKEAEEEKKQGQIGLLSKDNKIKEQQLKQESLIKKVLISGLILFSLIGIFIFRTLTLKRKNEKLGREQLENEMKVQQLESEKKQSDLQRQAAELEMQALRAQMNPHFIFNCLSSINKFILKNESREASDYLTRFSRLIRMVLTNSQLSMIPLNDEIEMLRLYLDMERLRFNNSFNYNIIYANTIEPETIYIPPMLLQPFCENAIWHGLMHKEGQGRLDIVMSIHDEQLQCTITDNGIGRTKAAELKSKSGEKQKSFGLKITTERLALFNNEKTVRTFYNSEDVLDTDGNIAGTEITLHIKYKNEIHEPVS
jgi:tetratricopeptide (TPR) repeat protein